MSGGHFDYKQQRIDDIADTLRLEIARARTKQEYYEYSDEFLAEMISAYNEARELAVKIQRIDWVISGDDGEKTYFVRLKEDMAKIEYDDPGRDAYWLSQEDED